MTSTLRQKNKRISHLASFSLIVLVVLGRNSYGFESRRRFFKNPLWGVPRRQQHTRNMLTKLGGQRYVTDGNCDDDDDETGSINIGSSDKVKEQKRRHLLTSSAAAFFSAVLGKPLQANAGPLSVLEEAETRRIGVFEQNAPSVVFIDTFAERQDVFSPNIMEVPLGTGSGFVWDKDGHIVTNYHVVRNAKFAQVALITPRKGEKSPIGLLSAPDHLAPASSVVDDKSSLDIFSASPSTYRASTNKVSSAEYKRTVFKAQVVGSDPGKDIAVLKIDAPGDLLYPIGVGRSSGLKVGMSCLAIGNPFGLDHSLTAGVISGLGREVKSPIGRPITNVIQV
jgi:S1-C subfamily serine protease